MVTRSARVRPATRGSAPGGIRSGISVAEGGVEPGDHAAVDRGAGQRGDDGLRDRLDVDGAVERRAAERLGEHRRAVLGDDERVQLVEAAGAVGGAREARRLRPGPARQREARAAAPARSVLRARVGLIAPLVPCGGKPRSPAAIRCA